MGSGVDMADSMTPEEFEKVLRGASSERICRTMDYLLHELLRRYGEDAVIGMVAGVIGQLAESGDEWTIKVEQYPYSPNSQN